MSHWTPRAVEATAKIGRYLVVLTMLLALGEPACADDLGGIRMGAPAETTRTLQLDVTLNGRRLALIGAFVVLADGRLAATPAELRELGIDIPDGPSPVALDTIPGLAFDLDEPGQAITLRVETERLTVRRIGTTRATAGEASKSAWGAALDYVAFAGASQQIGAGWQRRFDGGSLTLDGRVFSPHGVFSQSGIVGTTTGTERQVVRLESTFTRVDEERMLTWRAGDAVSGGLSWTRPVRFGGVQLQKNFALRSDLVTVPIPALSGSAAVPSTVDLWVDDQKLQALDGVEGRFQFSDMPIVTGGGEARMVVRDATGREVVTKTAFYVTPDMLRAGLYDYSIEAGLPRIGYGVESARYRRDPFGSWSLRAGATDWLTLESHGEFDRDFAMLGGGAVFSVFGRGAITVAAAASRSPGESGRLFWVEGQTRFRGINVHAAAQRTFGGYRDLASMSTDAEFEARLSRILSAGTAEGAALYALAAYGSNRPARSIDRFMIGAPILDGRSSVALSWVGMRTWTGTTSRILGLSASTTAWEGWLFASVNADFGDRRALFAHVGYGRPIGARGQATAGLAADRRTVQASATATRALGPEEGSWGWRVGAQETPDGTGSRSAEISHRTGFARFAVRAGQSNNAASGSIEAEGSIAATRAGVFAAGRIDDAFAVVDAGAPNVLVLHENRPVGRTDARGRILVPSLRAHEPNRLALDTTGLPLDAEPAMTETTVRPMRRSGVIVDFGVSDGKHSAEILLTDEKGVALGLGRTGRTRSGKSFAIGYDGRTWIADLDAHEILEIDGQNGPCTAEIEVPPKTRERLVLGPLACRTIAPTAIAGARQKTAIAGAQ